MKKKQTLWRVWMDDGRYRLVEAADRDAVYRSFKPKIRNRITRVDEVRKTSEVLRELAG